MLREKVQGVLGLRCFRSINDAMLMKYLLRILKHLDLCVSKALKLKYFKEGDLLSYKSKPTDSMVWKSV